MIALAMLTAGSVSIRGIYAPAMLPRRQRFRAIP
jgi:hypothetical protein